MNESTSHRNTLSNNVSLMAFVSFGLIIFGVRLFFINTYGSYMPYWDDWGMGGLLYDHHTSGIGLPRLVEEINSHRQVFGKLTSIFLFELNHRQWDVYVMMLANSFVWTFCGLFLINIARQHSHEINPTPIILLILVVWTYPVSLVNTLWGVQSHVYYMTLFAVLGCWLITDSPLSKKWWLGVFCLFAGGLTLAGGSFISVSIAFVYLILLIFDKAKRQQHLITFVVSALAAAFGLALILTQSGSNSSLIGNLFSVNALLTFAKTMSWPVRTQFWPFLVFVIPMFTILISIIKQGKSQSRLIPFVLCLYGFIVLIAVSIAVARNFDGSGPARRYMDFLTLAFVASSFALLIIQQKQFRLPERFNQILIIAWFAAIVVAIPFRLETTFYTFEDRAETIPYQEKYVRQYMNSFDIDILTDKPFRQVPFPRPESLGTHLQNFQNADILPYSLQKAPPLTHNPEQTPQQWQESAFISNGFYFPNRGVLPSQGWYGEIVMGSFYHIKGGGEVTGKFESNTFEIRRPYIMVPVVGYPNYPGMSLKLVEVNTGEEYDVRPPERSSAFAEVWREVLVPAKKGYYRLVAEDNNEQLWFAFAAPRSVGRLSYLSQKLFDLSKYYYLLGIVILCFLHRQKIVDSISK